MEVRGPSQDELDTHLKLADLTIFLMKLIQRLEGQSFSNLQENPKFTNKINETNYVMNRQKFNELKMPLNAEVFLKSIKQSHDQQYIDEYIMPKLIAMAKNHVDAINMIHTAHNALILKEKSEASNEMKRLKTFNEELVKESQELTEKLASQIH